MLFQSTTRTPIEPGGPAGQALRFEDNYHEGLDNFLYNAPIHLSGAALAAYETRPLPAWHDLCARLGARAVFF